MNVLLNLSRFLRLKSRVLTVYSQTFRFREIKIWKTWKKGFGGLNKFEKGCINAWEKLKVFYLIFQKSSKRLKCSIVLYTSINRIEILHKITKASFQTNRYATQYNILFYKIYLWFSAKPWLLFVIFENYQSNSKIVIMRINISWSFRHRKSDIIFVYDHQYLAWSWLLASDLISIILANLSCHGVSIVVLSGNKRHIQGMVSHLNQGCGIQ